MSWKRPSEPLTGTLTDPISGELTNFAENHHIFKKMEKIFFKTQLRQAKMNYVQLQFLPN